MTLVVPFAPGGGTDIGSRIVAQKLSQLWGQSVLVDNRGGAGGNLGLEIVSRAKPDGYTLLTGNVGTQSINPTLYKKLNYNPDTSFAPIGLFAELPFVLAVTPSLPANSVKELVALAKASPDKLTYASSGNGGSPHLSAETFKIATGTQILHIPYKGGGAAMTDLMSGNVNMIFSSVLETSAQIKAGKLKALAISSKNRVSALPDVPTLEESGITGAESGSWLGLLGSSWHAPANFGQNFSEFAASIGHARCSAAAHWPRSRGKGWHYCRVRQSHCQRSKKIRQDHFGQQIGCRLKSDGL